MTIATLICNYIYSSFLVVKAALEATCTAAKALLKVIDAIFTALLDLCRLIIDIGLKAIMQAIKIAYKFLSDLINGWTKSALDKICDGMFKCTALLLELLDSRSLVNRTIRKINNYNDMAVEETYKIINDFKAFKEQICTFGVTISLGISSLTSVLNNFNAQAQAFINMLERQKERIRKFLQRYIDLLADIGVFDLMDKLKLFFDCVLDKSEICKNIDTSQSCYNSFANKFKIKEAGNGYTLDPNYVDVMYTAVDSRINDLNEAKIKFKELMDTLMNVSETQAGANAFDISKNLLPGGMSLGDIAHGRWMKNKAYKYVVLQSRVFKEAFRHKSGYDCASTDFILNGTTINDEKGIVSVKLNDEDGNAQEWEFNIEDNFPGIEWKDCDVEFFTAEDGLTNTYEKALIDKKTDRMISTIRAAVEIAIEKNKELTEQCEKDWNTLKNYTKESELVTAW